MKTTVKNGHGYEMTVEYIYERYFEIRPGVGYGFPCDKDGNHIVVRPEARKNYEACLMGEVDGDLVVDKGVQLVNVLWGDSRD